MKENISTLKNIINSINDIESLSNLQEEFNTLYESKKKKIIISEEAKNLDVSSYFFIKESFENMSDSLFKTAKGKKIIGKYIKEHRNNKDLQKLFQVYDNLAAADSTLNVTNLVQEMKSIVGELNTKKLNEGIANVGALLKNAYVLIGEDAKNMLSENKEVEQYVNYVFNNPLKMSNVVTYNKCINEIKAYVDSNKIRKVKLSEKKTLNLENSLEEYNNLISEDNLSPEDFAILAEIKNSDNKSELFERYKNDCLASIDRAILINNEQVVCNKLNEFKTKINAKNFNIDTFGTDIANFIEFKNLVEN
jgi:hypothetical protein